MDYNESYNKLLKYINKHNSTIDETFKLIIIDLLTETNFDYNIFKKILKGAYIIINDSGFFYKKWVLYHKINLQKQKKELISFNSSHRSCSYQYRLGNGIIYDTNNDVTNNYDLLIGTINKNSNCNKPNTWFQLEKARLDSFYNILEHTYNYFTYLINNRNIGPFGESSHTEQNPIILTLRGALK
jgi:hypothetical protein